MEGMDESYYYSDSGESLDAYDQEQMEIALYCSLHFETNLEHSGVIEDCVNTDFDILVEGNDKSGYKAPETTAEYVLNQDIDKKYDSTLNDADEGNAKTKSSNSKKVNKAEQVADEVKKSKKIQSVLRKPNLHNKSLLGDSGIYSDNSKEDIICIDDDTSSMDSDSDDQDVLLGQSSSDSDDDDDIKINVVHTSDNTSTPRYTYTKITPGQSDTNIEEESDDSEHWAINEEDVFKDKGVIPRGRYYKPVRCHNCNYVGHLSKNCPKPKKAIVCALCADEGHVCRNCPKSFCYNCEAANHDSRYCTAPRRKLYRSCRRCQMPGHDEKECPEQWRQYHVTIRAGSINKFKLPRKRKRISCYNCGDDGHYGHECEEDRMNRFIRVNSPFITRYQNVKQFCDVINSVRRDDTVEQCEDANEDSGWKSFDDIDAHVKTLRENKRQMVTGKRMMDKESAETKKKPSEYLHMIKKSGKLHTGRNNFDKMTFTIQNEPRLKSGEEKLKHRKTSKVEGKEDKDLSVIDLTRKETRRDRQRKRKQGSHDDGKKCVSSNRKEEEDFPTNYESEIAPNYSGKASTSKKMRKLEASNKPSAASDKDTKVPKSKHKKSKQLTSIKETVQIDVQLVDECVDSSSKGRTVSYDQSGDGDMSITAKQTPVKSSTKSSINESSADSKKRRNKGSEFSSADSNKRRNKRSEFSSADSNKRRNKGSEVSSADSNKRQNKEPELRSADSNKRRNKEPEFSSADSNKRRNKEPELRSADSNKRRNKEPEFSSADSNKRQNKDPEFFSADSNKRRNKRPEFTADDLFSLWSIDSKDNKTDRRARISKKHVSHRNDNYAADDLFSLQKISKMQASGDIDVPAEEMDVDHQVHNNEWWNEGKNKRNRRRKNKHTRFQ